MAAPSSQACLVPLCNMLGVQAMQLGVYELDAAASRLQAWTRRCVFGSRWRAPACKS